jgi:hypothetical protein
MKIKGYKQFLEAISGTELVGKHMGPNYPEQDNSPMKKLGMTDVIYSDIFGRIVTYDEYQDLYFNYLKKGGTPLQDFNKENLDKVLDSIKEARNYDSYVKTEDDKIIEETFNDIFIDFLTDYSMKAYFNPGLYIPKFHGWMSVYTWNEIKTQIDPEIGQHNWSKCMKISIINEHWDSTLGKKGQDEIYMDEESESKFNECIKTLESILKEDLKDLVEIEYPEKFEKSWWQIPILIKYNE